MRFHVADKREGKGPSAPPFVTRELQHLRLSKFRRKGKGKEKLERRRCVDGKSAEYLLS